MDPKHLEELRRQLRDGKVFTVKEGHVYLQDETTGVPKSGKPSPSEPVGVEVKHHRWGNGLAFTWSDAAQRRIFAEKALLDREYPRFQFDLDNAGNPYVHGIIGPTETLKQAYHVLVVLPPDYGTGAMPMAYVLKPDLKPGAPHQYADGHLCLDESGAFTARSTLVTFLAWVSAWLVLAEGWAETGVAW